MEIIIIVLLFIIGVILIVKGGDLFVDAASWIAEVFRIPKFIIGATIVSLATTLPEMIVSVLASSQGKVDMAVGNAVGSVISNIALIMAISIIFMPIEIKRHEYIAKSILLIMSSFILVILGFSGKVNLILSFVLLAIFVLAMWDSVKQAKGTKVSEEENKKEATKKEMIINISKFVLGAVGIVVGADLLVDNGSALARILKISERIIAVTIIAVGTSLPELVTTITAIAKKEASLSLGNIIGANIIDLTLILPICALVSKGYLPISKQVATLDIPMCFVVGLVSLVPALIGKRFYRWQGVSLITIYILYMMVNVLL